MNKNIQQIIIPTLLLLAVVASQPATPAIADWPPVSDPIVLDGYVLALAGDTLTGVPGQTVRLDAYYHLACNVDWDYHYTTTTDDRDPGHFQFHVDHWRDSQFLYRITIETDDRLAAFAPAPGVVESATEITYEEIDPLEGDIVAYNLFLLDGAGTTATPVGNPIHCPAPTITFDGYVLQLAGDTLVGVPSHELRLDAEFRTPYEDWEEHHSTVTGRDGHFQLPNVSCREYNDGEYRLTTTAAWAWAPVPAIIEEHAQIVYSRENPITLESGLAPYHILILESAPAPTPTPPASPLPTPTPPAPSVQSADRLYLPLILRAYDPGHSHRRLEEGPAIHRSIQ